ncbi:YbgA family protein [Streptomonospora litoralis]|uniref:DUF1722 domain-containing protein n=1 Tax=Streptomonospora litoralis TaxID=2498135 RepID=A0A4P6PYP8_9ACTN|nr:DUF523 and DUF1722 domain-containing protein [Streptomonospora litoralis]QBI52830.1 hypothetical protein EKD16_05115 [Streptomonospora litoralis]
MGIHADEHAGARPRVGASSCLLGAPVRYNGGHSRDRFLTDLLDRHVDWVPVCPEAEIGLGVPRETLRLERAGGEDRVVATRSRTDRTDELRAVADRHSRSLSRLDGYVLKNKSPSCGLFGLPVFEGENRVGGRGRGAFAARLTELHPDLPVEEQGRLSDPGLREHFVERVFAHARLRALFAGDAGNASEPGAGGGEADDPAWRPRDLVDFHSRHKLQLMAHAPEGYRATGRIVADAGTRPPAAVERDYTAAFTRTLARPTTPGRNANALQHAFGMVSGQLDDARRRDLLDAIDRYRDGLVPLNVPVALIRHHCDAENVAWAREQTYLAPFPADLRLRNALAAS